MITPNRLTALRVFLAFISPLLLIWYRTPIMEIITILLFTAACITDWWDGHLARTKSMITAAGKIADPIADKLLIIGLMLAFVFFKLYSFWWIVAILTREIAVTCVRIMRLRRGQVIPAEWAGKVKVGFQIGSVYASLLYLVILDSGFDNRLVVASEALHYIGILIANAVTLFSGITFFYHLRKI
ncbi:MAG: CDP-alcohol phosphatidyltransferase family protein [Candidatus Omnitrophica bacterium]|nr:CDP-alcohol phosphatidyltransferase family protein [Candidatus Omnitrophota bacterium]